MALFPKLFERFYLTSSVPAPLVPEVLGKAAAPYWLEFRKESDTSFRILWIITYNNLFAHAFKSVMTLTVSSTQIGSCLEVGIKPHVLRLAMFVLWVLFGFLILVWGLFTSNVIVGLVAVGSFVFVYLIITVQQQIDSEIFSGFLEDVLSPSDRKEA
jgi:hypothetical protein